MMQVKSLVFYGDSKTLDPIVAPCLAILANRFGALPRLEARMGLGGRSVASGVLTIADDLAVVSGNADVVLFNLGANDVSGVPVEATWTANCGTILDAMHTKWPSAKIYLMRVWRRDYEDRCAMLNDSFVPTVISTRGFAYVGPDEGVFLEAGDDGETLTTDGIHPNAAGQIATGQAWGNHISL